MKHTMKLLSEPFDEIVAGVKDIEYRVNDEKRQKISVGDVIEFFKLPDLKESLEVRVTERWEYKNFLEMFTDLFELFKDEYCSPQEVAEAMYEVYTKEDEELYGGLAIKFE
ncbi:MAG TPA: hypothetical protein DEP72_01520 [Clostridiales bacterium]|nr:hypothetical protein [Clostridiales bacterium]